MPEDKAEAFGSAVRQAVQNYLDDIQRLTLREIRDAIEGLGKAAYKARKAPQTDAKAKPVAEALKLLPDEVRAFLQGIPGRLPDVNEVLNPSTRRDALDALIKICITGSKIEHEGLSDDGKSPKRRLRIQFAGPKLTGRPTDYAARILCAQLAFAYEQNSGKPPGRWREGPLEILLSEVAELYGLKFNAENIARWYFKEMSLLEAQTKPVEKSDDGNSDINFAGHIDD